MMMNWTRMDIGVLACALALGTAPAVTAGGDDGGVEPSFFEGAGIRALGMGGAYTAVADDASAPTWNPGGLGLVQRPQFQASHTNLIGLGFSEQYASIVYPTWRYGVGSFTYRQLGSGGFEARDDRNLLLGEDLSAGETELRFGFGRPVSANVSVGTTFNFYRQSVAGYSDTGVGLDLGMHARPLAMLGGSSTLAERTKLGLVVRNLIQPSVRLDQESVRDPKGLRFGLAYDHPFGLGRGLVAALDIEKADDTSMRAQLGVEVRPMAMFALRGSTGGNGFTAGTGVTWNAMNIDYAFEGNTLGSIHRFGVQWAFGSSVDDRRASYLAERDAEMNRRLAAAFDQRQQDRVNSLIEQAEAALSRRESEAALRSLSMAEVIAPDHRKVRKLQAAALVVKGLDEERTGDPATAVVTLTRAVSLDPTNGMASDALGRVRALSDRRAARTTEIRQLYAEALDAFVAEDLDGASRQFRRVLELAPNDVEAQGMLRRVEEAMTTRAKRLVDQARVLAEASKFDAAERTLQAAADLDPDVPGIAATRSSIRAAKRNIELARQVQESKPADTAPEPAPDTRRTLTEEEKREMADLYQRGLAAIQARRHDEAIRYWELVWAMDETYLKVVEYLNREYVTRGMERFATGRLREAVTDWESALRIDPDDSRAQGYLQRAQEQLARYEEIVTKSGQ